MDADKVAADEARRIAQHDRIKERLEEDVQAHIAREATASSTDDLAHYGSLAAGLKRKATAEVLETEAELERGRRVVRANQVVDYCFFVIYGLVGLEFGLELLGARQSAGFKRFLDVITTPLLGPFRGLMPDPSLGSLQLMLSYVVALVVYLLLHGALRRFFKLLAGTRR